MYGHFHFLVPEGPWGSISGGSILSIKIYFSSFHKPLQYFGFEFASQFSLVKKKEAGSPAVCN